MPRSSSIFSSTFLDLVLELPRASYLPRASPRPPPSPRSSPISRVCHFVPARISDFTPPASQSIDCNSLESTILTLGDPRDLPISMVKTLGYGFQAVLWTIGSLLTTPGPNVSAKHCDTNRNWCVCVQLSAKRAAYFCDRNGRCISICEWPGKGLNSSACPATFSAILGPSLLLPHLGAGQPGWYLQTKNMYCDSFAVDGGLLQALRGGNFGGSFVRFFWNHK